MNINEIKSTIGAKGNGRFFMIDMSSNLEKKMSAWAKNNGYTVTKKTHAQVRKLNHYYNQKAVWKAYEAKGGIMTDPETGKKELVIEPHESWYERVDGTNYLVRHKKNTNKYYVVLYPTSVKPKVSYYLNNKLISKDELKKSGIMQNSYWNTESGNAMTIGIENIETVY